MVTSNVSVWDGTCAERPASEDMSDSDSDDLTSQGGYSVDSFEADKPLKKGAVDCFKSSSVSWSGPASVAPGSGSASVASDSVASTGSNGSTTSSDATTASSSSSSEPSVPSTLSKDEESLATQSIYNPRGIFWEGLKSERSRKVLVDVQDIDMVIDDILRVLDSIAVPLEEVACQVTYLELCKTVRAKVFLLRQSVNVLGTCDYRSMDAKDQKMLLTDIENIRESSGIKLKHFIERLVLRKNVLGKTRVRVSDDFDVEGAYEDFIDTLDKSHREINAMVDATVTTAMACRLGFNEINIKKRMKQNPTALKQMYEGIYEDRTVAVTAFKVWDWTEARRIASLTTRSDSLLDFFGYALHDDIYYLTYEYANLGHLTKFITESSQKGAQMHYITIMALLKQILEGLTYLHDSGFRMGTLTTKTVLVCKHGPGPTSTAPSSINIKLHLRTVTEKEDTSVVEDHDEFGDIRWRRKSPEAMGKNEEYANSDVYAAGIVLWEAFSGGLAPWSDKQGDSDICDAVCSGDCLPRPDACPEMLYNGLLLPMWRINPGLRPGAMELNCKMDQLMHLSEVYDKDMQDLTMS